MSQLPEDEHLRVFSIESPDSGVLDDGTEDDAQVEKPSIDAVLESLRRGVVRPIELVGLSDLGSDDAEIVEAAWSGLPSATRLSTVRETGEMIEDRLDYHFGRFLRVALDDEDEGVRQLAIAGLWEDEGTDLAGRLSGIMESDESQDVRAQAALGLSRFAEWAELGRLAPDTAESVRQRVFAVALDNDESWHVRRRAVEAASSFGSDPRLVGLIEQLFEEDELGLRATAVYAMGRSMEARWLVAVINEFASDDAEIRYESARAAGLLADTSALPGLSELAQDEDLEVRLAAITSIGQIGGSAAVRILRRLVEDAPDTDEEAIDDALIEASIVADPLSLDAESVP
jgi:HEAT repeat protein